jgi:hypothetical protein
MFDNSVQHVFIIIQCNINIGGSKLEWYSKLLDSNDLDDLLLTGDHVTCCPDLNVSLTDELAVSKRAVVVATECSFSIEFGGDCWWEVNVDSSRCTGIVLSWKDCEVKVSAGTCSVVCLI